MKMRQGQIKEYHELRIRVPLNLWEKVKERAEKENKSYALTVVELMRLALESLS